jgi:hypothetical protein
MDRMVITKLREVDAGVVARTEAADLAAIVVVEGDRLAILIPHIQAPTPSQGRMAHIPLHLRSLHLHP